jgi:hypothetical protein
MISGGHWVGTGFQPLWLLLVVVFGFSLVLWGVGQLLEFLTGTVSKHRPDEPASPLSGLENIDIPTGEHFANVTHVPGCEEIISSCVEGLHH